ncbi:hypothetical protein BKA70DRAFT_1491212 [Coprinopsis sp. MPI-PUGE-AT-0042]|nr:hypothetical protein BKA70DRAFT_1491212 [Coprinopsis sp. MPI-PUGE-AT-0042]
MLLIFCSPTSASGAYKKSSYPTTPSTPHPKPCSRKQSISSYPQITTKCNGSQAKDAPPPCCWRDEIVGLICDVELFLDEEVAEQEIMKNLSTNEAKWRMGFWFKNGVRPSVDQIAQYKDRRRSYQLKDCLPTTHVGATVNTRLRSGCRAGVAPPLDTVAKKAAGLLRFLDRKITTSVVRDANRGESISQVSMYGIPGTYTVKSAPTPYIIIGSEWKNQLPGQNCSHEAQVCILKTTYRGYLDQEMMQHNAPLFVTSTSFLLLHPFLDVRTLAESLLRRMLKLKDLYLRVEGQAQDSVQKLTFIQEDIHGHVHRNQGFLSFSHFPTSPREYLTPSLGLPATLQRDYQSSCMQKAFTSGHWALWPDLTMGVEDLVKELTTNIWMPYHLLEELFNVVSPRAENGMFVYRLLFIPRRKDLIDLNFYGKMSDDIIAPNGESVRKDSGSSSKTRDSRSSRHPGQKGKERESLGHGPRVRSSPCYSTVWVFLSSGQLGSRPG